MAELKFGARSSDLIDDYNALIYIINSVVKKVNTADLVRVMSVDTDKKTLTVIPVVKNANAEGDAIEESPIYGVRYFEWQFGGNAIKGTPEVGDIGLIVVCKKDISNAEAGIVQTYREYCLSDSIYIGGIFGLNKEPTQFIEFTENGINITSQKDITIACNNALVNATTSATITSPAVNLGGEGGVPLARHGDQVKSGNTVVGTIVATTTISKSL